MPNVFLEEGFSEDQLMSSTHLLGMPAHKLSGLAIFYLGKKVSLAPSFTYTSKRYGFYGVDENDVSLAKAFGPVLLLNANVQWKNLLAEGLSLALGVNDALNQRYTFLQPYNGYHAPVPGSGIEWTARVAYIF
jgi:outer membrane receptor protein involved in Fe transport